IELRLGLREPVRVATGFDRPNLTFAVLGCRSGAEVSARLVAALEDPRSRPAIVYAGTRAQCEQTARELSATLGVEALAYHAGLPRDRRATVQRRFMDGEVPVVVATNAFGMGVDKADVRSVVHISVPPSLEAWYQEAGRAGRDGRPARALLLAQAKDKGLHVHFIERSELSDAALDRAAERLVGSAQDDRVDVDARELGADQDQVRAIVGHLVRAGVIVPAPAPVDRVRGRIAAPYDGRARAACRTSAADAIKARWRQYRAMWAFVEGDECRRAVVLRHFGDAAAPAAEVPCCDVCAPQAAVGDVAGIEAAAGSAKGRSRGGSAPARRPAGPPVDAGLLDEAIFEVVASARPGVGRTRTVEILRGGRSQVVARNGYDGLPAYGAFSGLRADDLLARVDELLDEGRLVSTGGRFPKLTLGGGR
ncbi:MAG: ATP-dependent DNA helicase RecQ, partial [Actinobacteria bacterium]|nr:ATP-dependent DNA helicase RecQ [Actinomycetota bacterium]